MDLGVSRLGEYDIGAEIGRGSTGIVYRAYSTGLARPVAVKVLHPYLSRKRELVQLLLHIVRAAARLNHPHLITTYAVGEQDGRYYLVMEYVEGQPLSQILRERERLPDDQTVSLLQQMADVLDCAHSQGLVHGGVKPSNVMINAEGQVKLADLGFAHFGQDTSIAVGETVPSDAQYLSPEQASGWEAGPSADLYSLAVIAYELLTGAPPFDANSTPTILYKQSHELPPPVVLGNPDLPPAVDTVFSRALAKEPHERFPSAQAFVTSLTQALGSRSPAIAAAQPTLMMDADRQGAVALPARSFRTRRFAGAALVAVLLLMGALAVSGVIGGSNSPSRPTNTDEPAGGPVVTADDTNAAPASTHTPVDTVTDGGTSVASTRVSTPTGETVTEGTVQVPVADVRTEPDPESGLVTQVLMGEQVMLQEKRNGWYRIAAVHQPSPDDPHGYPGWLRADAVSVQPYDTTQVAIVMVPATPLRKMPASDGSIIFHLSIDSRLAFTSTDGEWLGVVLPDGTAGWLSRDDVRLVCRAGSCQGGVAGTADVPRPADEIVDTALRLIETRYLWGGTSSTAFDCSGFVYRILHANGVTVPRDSLPMSRSGTWVERDELRPGDIIFTAQGGASGRVSHCALYLGEGRIITAIGSDPFIITALDDARYRDNYWGARRYP